MDTNLATSADAAISGIEEEVLISLRRIIRAVDLYSRQLVSETGLSGPQLICLRQLSNHGPMQTNHLARAVNLSAATVCGILNRLEQRGLVIRERQQNDRRRVFVSLSPVARDAIEQAPPALHDAFLFKFRALSARQQENINKTLDKIVTMMSADELDAAPMLVPGESVASASETKI